MRHALCAAADTKTDYDRQEGLGRIVVAQRHTGRKTEPQSNVQFRRDAPRAASHVRSLTLGSSPVLAIV